MGCFEDGILNNYATITSADENGHSFSLTANTDTSEEDDMRDIVINQLALFIPDDGGLPLPCYIRDIFDSGILLCGRDTSEKLVQIDSDKWIALYRDGEPAMVKRNIFGRINKNFW